MHMFSFHDIFLTFCTYFHRDMKEAICMFASFVYLLNYLRFLVYPLSIILPYTSSVDLFLVRFYTLFFVLCTLICHVQIFRFLIKFPAKCISPCNVHGFQYLYITCIFPLHIHITISYNLSYI